MQTRNKIFKPKAEAVNFILMDGGVGDHIASLTAVNYIVRKYTFVKCLVWVPDYLLDLSLHLLPSKATVRNFSSMKKYYNPDLPTKTTKWDGVVSPMKTSCTEYAFMKLCDEKPELKDMNYLQIQPNKIDITKFDLPKDYIVITTGYTAEVREFPAVEVNKILDYTKHNSVYTVFLGSTSTKTGTAHTIKGNFDATINFDQGVNLIDKTSLLEAARIMSDAKAVLGVDNGLLHVAGCTQVPIIGGFTTVNPEYRMPVRNGVLGWQYYPIIPDDDLKCKFCQCTTNFLYGHNYTKCLYKDNLCTKQMTADKFITQLNHILK